MNAIEKGFLLLQKALDGSALRHQVIAGNLANVNTPGFHTRDVEFQKALAAALEGRGGDIEDVKPEIFEAEGLPARQDGNNVDLDKELVKMIKNALYYSTLTRITRAKISMLRSAITGRS